MGIGQVSHRNTQSSVSAQLQRSLQLSKLVGSTAQNPEVQKWGGCAQHACHVHIFISGHEVMHIFVHDLPIQEEAHHELSQTSSPM